MFNAVNPGKFYFRQLIIQNTDGFQINGAADGLAGFKLRPAALEIGRQFYFFRRKPPARGHGRRADINFYRLGIQHNRIARGKNIIQPETGKKRIIVKKAGKRIRPAFFGQIIAVEPNRRHGKLTAFLGKQGIVKSYFPQGLSVDNFGRNLRFAEIFDNPVIIIGDKKRRFALQTAGIINRQPIVNLLLDIGCGIVNLAVHFETRRINGRRLHQLISRSGRNNIHCYRLRFITGKFD